MIHSRFFSIITINSYIVPTFSFTTLSSTIVIIIFIIVIFISFIIITIIKKKIMSFFLTEKQIVANFNKINTVLLSLGKQKKKF